MLETSLAARGSPNKITRDCEFIAGAIERQKKLRDMGVQKLLQQLLSTSNTTLFDK